jgi:hypothetical protein
MQMISLTKGLTLTFSCKHDVYPILDLFGLGGNKSNVRSDDPNVVTFAKPDFIMVPGHGFSVSWSPEGLTLLRRVRTLPFAGGESTSKPESLPPAALSTRDPIANEGGAEVARASLCSEFVLGLSVNDWRCSI